MPNDRRAIRQCVGCRERTARDSLIRLVADPNGQLVIDLKGRLPGRGAWVHASTRCVDAVVAHPQLLQRTLKRPVDVSSLSERICEVVCQALFHGLSLAAAGGGLVVGFDRLATAVRERRTDQVLVAKDAAERTIVALQRVLETAVPGRTPTVVPWSRLDIGTQIGQGPCAVLGVVTMPATDYLRAQLQRFRDLG